MNAKINLNERNFINQIVSGTRDRVRKIMHVGRRNYTSPDSCTDMHDYCGAMGCALDIFDDKGNYALGYIAKDDWYIKPVNEDEGLGKKPTYELVVPLANGDLRIIKVINNKITETVVKQ